MLLHLAALQTGARLRTSSAWPSAASPSRKLVMTTLVSTLAAADIVAACSTILQPLRRPVAAMALAPTSVIVCHRHHPPACC